MTTSPVECRCQFSTLHGVELCIHDRQLGIVNHNLKVVLGSLGYTWHTHVDSCFITASVWKFKKNLHFVRGQKVILQPKLHTQWKKHENSFKTTHDMLQILHQVWSPPKWVRWVPFTLPKTNRKKAPENRQSQQEMSSSNHWFSGAIRFSKRLGSVSGL